MEEVHYLNNYICVIVTIFAMKTAINMRSSIQAVDSNDHLQISCSDFDVGGFFFDCTDDTFTISNVNSNGQVFQS